MSAIDYDARAGARKPWWDTMVTLIIARPEIGNGDLALALEKDRATIYIIRRSSVFLAMLAEAQKLATKLPAAVEAIAAFEGGENGKGKPGLRFTYSRGQLENRMRELIMEAANETVPVLDAEGKETGERRPALSGKEKWELANRTLAAIKQPNNTFVGKQTNNLNVGIPGGRHHSDDLPPALLEMMTYLENSIPTKRIELPGGGFEFVADTMKDVTPTEAKK